MARHRWRHESQYVGLTRVQLAHAGRRAELEHQRRAREQVERRSDEVVRMAHETGVLTYYLPFPLITRGTLCPGHTRVPRAHGIINFGRGF